MVRYLNKMIKKYFAALKRKGYYRYSTVIKMIYLLGLYEMIREFGQYIKPEDKKIISKSINCIMGTDCLFDVTPMEITDTVNGILYNGIAEGLSINDLLLMIEGIRQDIPTKVSQLTNDAGYLQSDLI